MFKKLFGVGRDARVSSLKSGGEPRNATESRMYPPVSLRRISDVSIKDSRNPSSVFTEDLHRIYNSFAFRRLAHKTQLFPVAQNDYVRNRLTHSLEVASTARSIASHLNNTNSSVENDPIDENVVQAAALCHDLGHPPFGHTGESELDRCMAPYGGFEGNAQSLRMIVSLEHGGLWDCNRDGDMDSGDAIPGLNLSLRSVASIIKYDNELPSRRASSAELEKGYFPDERQIVDYLRSSVCQNGKPRAGFPTIECDIMDMADDIVYCASDLDDAMKMNYLDAISSASAKEAVFENVSTKVKYHTNQSLRPIEIRELLIAIFSEGYKLQRATKSSQNAMQSAIEGYRESRHLAENSQRRASFCRRLTQEFVDTLALDYNEKCPVLSRVRCPIETRVSLEAIKGFIYEFVITSPEIQTMQFKMRFIINNLFDALMEDYKTNVFPKQIRERIEMETSEAGKARIVSDYMSAMTDSYARELMERHRAIGGDTIYKPIY